MSRYNRKIVKCEQCDKEFERKNYHVQLSKRQFCGFPCYAKWQSVHRSGKNNPNYKPSSHSVFECAWCGGQFEDRILDRKRGSKDLTFCSREHFQLFAQQHYNGDGNPFWKGGHKDYRGSTWKVMRKKALKRDNHICQMCGKKENLVVHHKKHFSLFRGETEANVLDNLQTLCRECHALVHNPLRYNR